MEDRLREGIEGLFVQAGLHRANVVDALHAHPVIDDPASESDADVAAFD